KRDSALERLGHIDSEGVQPKKCARRASSPGRVAARGKFPDLEAAAWEADAAVQRDLPPAIHHGVGSFERSLHRQAPGRRCRGLRPTDQRNREQRRARNQPDGFPQVRHDCLLSELGALSAGRGTRDAARGATKRRHGAAVPPTGTLSRPRRQSSSGGPNTATQPLVQIEVGILFAGRGTNTWLLCGLTATECAVPRGAGEVEGVLNVGTRWISLWFSASITPRTGPSGSAREAV